MRKRIYLLAIIAICALSLMTTACGSSSSTSTDEEHTITLTGATS